MDDYKSKYDEALERAKSFKTPELRDVAEYIFPELKESEDERIRKELICFLDAEIPQCEARDKYIAWLEKQGEQNPTDKIELKFKVGDWITNGACTIQITSIDDKYYWHDNNHVGGDIESIDKQYHLWTIQDAKDGDILCTPNGNTFIFKTIDGDKILDYCGLYFNKFFSDSGSPNGSSTHYDKCNYHPATKEQRDLLFKKMHEAGYEWDADKKELRKIDARKNLTLDGDLMQADCMIVEQKHTQEIEPFEAEHGKYYYCIKDYFCGGRKQASKGDVVQALRGLPIMGLKDASEYFLPVNFIKCNSAWSEEDEEFLKRAIKATKDLYPITSDWLKNLKDRVQPKQEWTEDDKRILDALITSLINERFAGHLEFLKGIKVSSVIDWLKSLKEKRQ